MNTNYTFIPDLANEAEPPANGILSRTLYQDDQIKVVLFGFGRGEELSEHTASKPAVLHIIKGEGTVGLGKDQQSVQAGSWIHMPAGLRHSIRATTPLVLLLALLK